MDPLSVRLIRQGVVYPTIRVASRPGRLLMGVYDEHGHYVEDTVLNRRAGEQGAPMPRDLFPEVSDVDAPEAIYAGPLYFHFGHFLLESLARSWYARQHPELPLAWAGQHDWQQMTLRPWQTEILEILSLPNPTTIVADPTRFPLLHVPDIGYRYDDRFHPRHAEFLAHYEGPAQVPGHRLWLSRSQVDNDARDLNVGATERRLADAGWTVTHPESLGVREQLDHLSRAEVIAGEEGSAFHALVLLRDVAGKKFHVLRRHGREHGNMHTVGDARGVDQTFSSVEHQVVLRAEGRFVSKMTPNSSEVLDQLGVPVPTAPDGATSSADAVLARALAGLAPQRFLDVGAARADLVTGCTAPVRVAVSRRFAFDPRSHAATGTDFYELDLEQYIDLFHEGRGRFDVIRLSGTDFRQVMAAFRVSKRVAHQGTRWLLGDGEVASRAALAVNLTQPGFTARRVVALGAAVHLAWRVADEPNTESGVEKLSTDEVRRRLRWVRPVGLGSIERRARGAGPR